MSETPIEATVLGFEESVVSLAEADHIAHVAI
jgi:hypothetical protein